MEKDTTVQKQGADTQAAGQTEGNDTATQAAGSDTGETKPYKTFATEADFNRHSVGILNSAKNKAEKELLALLGLKPDEKDKLSKFKEAYDNTLSEAEKQAKNISSLNDEVKNLKDAVSEKEAIILALSQMTGKNVKDVDKLIRMAKGLVDDNTNLEQALQQVLSLTKTEKTPVSKPLTESNVKGSAGEKNPFKTGNLTEQGKLIKTDREKARELYFAVYGKGPSW